MLKIGVLISNDGDPFDHKLGSWIIFFGHEPIFICENELCEYKSIKINSNSIDIGITIFTNDGCKIDFDTIDVFYRRSWHLLVSYSKNEEELFRKQEAFAIRNLV